MTDNVVYFLANRNYLQLAWTAAKTAAAGRNRCFDVVLITEPDHGIPHFHPPKGCKVIEIKLPDQALSWPLPIWCRSHRPPND